MASFRNRSAPLWLTTSAAALTAVAVGLTVWYRAKQLQEQQQERIRRNVDAPEGSDPDVPMREIQTNNNNDDDVKTTNGEQQRILTRGSITIAHGSMTGTCAKFAQQLYQTLQTKQQQNQQPQHNHYTSIQLGSTQDWDWWDEFVNDEGENDQQQQQQLPPALLILFLPTYTDGTWPPVATNLESALQELQNDWRVAKNPLKGKLQVALFGMGSSEYNDTSSDTKKISNNSMGRPVRQAVRHFQKLGAKSIVKLLVGDDAVGNHAFETFQAWQEALLQRPRFQTSTVVATAVSSKQEQQKQEQACGCASETEPASTNAGCCQSGGRVGSTDGSEEYQTDNMQSQENGFDNDNDYPSDDDDDQDDQDDGGEPQVMDLEDMGDAVHASAKAAGASDSMEPREMVTPSQALALKKEGYRLIGTHSAVKLCRWTKHQLRGRGGCYKHTFYGITSYQCMEATPSLACANKCVFCWRHHKNPVGKEWRWKTDDPHFIVDQAVKEHIKMIKEAKGIPGVRMDRWNEAHTVRHCALSLVGEPIMYPRIDEFLGDLHQRKISTFLVTNGQHPAAIATLRPVTQLYVSVDAPTQETLIAIDRPLFRDAWDRLKQSLSSLKNKGQRTVARLTVVKGWNSDEIAGYAQLIALGQVSLVEVKGVTFCGKSDASNLNMSNTPWHHEVVELTRTLKNEIDKIRQQQQKDEHGDVPPEYGLACEHKHSCSVLLARVDQFFVQDATTGQGRWHTWIDYDKFHELAARYAADSSFEFRVQDYTAETPAWALFAAQEEGFDPTDSRHRKQTKHPMYTQFDDGGIPTHDHNNMALTEQERARLTLLMNERRRVIGAGSTVTELRGGEKEIQDASLMFRGLVVAK